MSYVQLTDKFTFRFENYCLNVIHNLFTFYIKSVFFDRSLLKNFILDTLPCFHEHLNIFLSVITIGHSCHATIVVFLLNSKLLSSKLAEIIF